MSESRDIASNLIADKLRNDLEEDLGKPFNFDGYIKFCIKSRQSLIDCLDDGTLAEKYRIGMDNCSRFTKLHELVSNELIEYKKDIVVKHFVD